MLNNTTKITKIHTLKLEYTKELNIIKEEYNLGMINDEQYDLNTMWLAIDFNKKLELI